MNIEHIFIFSVVMESVKVAVIGIYAGLKIRLLKMENFHCLDVKPY